MAGVFLLFALAFLNFAAYGGLAPRIGAMWAALCVALAITSNRVFHAAAALALVALFVAFVVMLTFRAS